MKQSYSNQIKHPKWQKLRLKIFERDNFTCSCCSSKEKQLQVHHLYYLPNTLIWNYDEEALVTVCYKCHEILTKELPKLSGLIAFNILSNKLDYF
jgi:5-methylcytosine-specific restriction endonuclease McrA